jgi:hypothetical protein
MKNPIANILTLSKKAALIKTIKIVKTLPSVPDAVSVH